MTKYIKPEKKESIGALVPEPNAPKTSGPDLNVRKELYEKWSPIF